MTKLSNAEYVAQRRQANLGKDNENFWHWLLVCTFMNRLPMYPELHEALIGDLRDGAERTDDPVTKAGLEKALEHLIAL